MNKPNENILHGIACPKCGHTQNFIMQIMTQVHVEDDGAEMDEHNSVEWDDNTPIECLNEGCRHAGTVKDFSNAE